jgi:hypothetical protein
MLTRFNLGSIPSTAKIQICSLGLKNKGGSIPSNEFFVVLIEGRWTTVGD